MGALLTDSWLWWLLHRCTQSITRFNGDILEYKEKLRRIMAQAEERQNQAGWTASGDAGTAKAAPAKEAASRKEEEAPVRKSKRAAPKSSGIVLASAGNGLGEAPPARDTAKPRGASGSMSKWGSRAAAGSGGGSGDADWSSGSWR